MWGTPGPAFSLSCPVRGFHSKPADGTGRAHKLTIRSTPEIRYGSNGFRVLTCLEAPLPTVLSSHSAPPSNGLEPRACPDPLPQERFSSPGDRGKISGEQRGETNDPKSCSARNGGSFLSSPILFGSVSRRGPGASGPSGLPEQLLARGATANRKGRSA